MPSIQELRKQAAEKLGFTGDMQLSPLMRSMIDSEVDRLQVTPAPTPASDDSGGVADWILEASKGFQMATQALPNTASFIGNLAMDDFNQTGVGQALQGASDFFERGQKAATELQSQGFRDKMAAQIYDEATGEWSAPNSTQVLGTILTALPQIPMYVSGAGVANTITSGARLAPRAYKLAKLAGLGSASSLKIARTLPGMANYGLAGGILGGGDTYAESYGTVMEKLKEYDIPEGQKDRVASKLATEAGRRQMPVAAVMNAVGLGGAAGTTGALWKRLAVGALEEIPSEAIEEGAQGLNVNLSTRELDPSTDIWAGVRTRAALGAIAGGVMGGGVAALDGNPVRQRQLADLQDDINANPDDILSGRHQVSLPEMPAAAPEPEAPSVLKQRLAPPKPDRAPEAQQAWDAAEVSVALAADASEALEKAIPNWSKMDNRKKAEIIDAVIDSDGEGQTEAGKLVQKWAQHQAAAIAAVQNAHALDNPDYGKSANAGDELLGSAEAVTALPEGGPSASAGDEVVYEAGGVLPAEASVSAGGDDVLRSGATTDSQPALSTDGTLINEGTIPKQNREPWQLSLKEWSREREAIRPNVAQSRLTRKSKSEAVRNGERLEYLTYGVTKAASQRLKEASEVKVTLPKDEVDSLLERVNTPVSHRDVIEKALAEGKPVPPEVLADYPDIAAPDAAPTAAKEETEAKPVESEAASAETDKEPVLSFREERAKAVAERQAREAENTAGRRDNYHDEPTQAQKEAGNYKKEKMKWNGLDLSIENQAGTMRRGTDPNGKAWEVQLQFDYGYVRGTKGADGDHVDVYLGPNLTGDKVFIVNQMHANGKFDEHKVMLGFESEKAATDAYLSNYEAGWDRYKDVVEMSVAQFKAWLESGDTSEPAVATAEETSRAPAATSSVEDDTSRVKATTSEAADRIEDFGEKIGGARKDIWGGFKSSLEEELPADLKAIILSKYFPEPDYAKLIEAGVSVETLAAIKAMRDQMPAKPRQTWKLNAWVENLGVLRDLSARMLDGRISFEEMRSKMLGQSLTLARFVDKIDIYAGVGYPAFLKADGASLSWGTHFTYEGNNRTDHPNTYSVSYESRRFTDQLFTSKAGAIAALRDHINKLGEAEKKPRETKLDLYRVTSTGKVMIGKKIASNRFIDLKEFDSVKESRAYLAEHESELLEQLEKFREQQNNVPTRRFTNDPRKGEDYRQGEDISPEAFGKAFGFRGVEFGNWVEQGRRQQDLNNAYDALMDLAKVVGIPAKAVSLNGSLGLAFGARGRAGAAAHYEPDKVVINLTKKEGAGALGHEWWHAMDNYFSRQRGLPAELLSARPHELKQTGVRPEVISAFGSLMKAIKSSPMAKRSAALDKHRPKDYWSTPEELSARAFESYLIAKTKEKGEANDYLANLIDPATARVVFEGGTTEWPYPFDNEMEPIVEAFDNLFRTIKTKETDKGVAMYKRNDINFGVLKADAEATLRQDKFVARLIDAGRIVVHENGSTLPTDGPDKDGILGVAMPDGVIHLNAGAHDAADGIKSTLLHEAFHARVKPLIGDKSWKKLMQNLDAIYEQGQKGDAKVDAFFQQALEQVESDTVNQDDLTRAQKVEELGAYAIDHYDTAPKSLRMWVDMLLAKVKAWAMNYFGVQLGKVSPAQLRELARMAIRDGRYDQYRSEMKAAYHRAWHGSPHEFDKFTTEKMGTGEGVQAYGWGMYFAGRKAVAEHYQKALTKPNIPDDVPDSVVEAMKMDIGSLDAELQDEARQAVARFSTASHAYNVVSDVRKYGSAEVADWLEKHIVGEKKKGSLYEVDLKPQESDYLLWDKPLSEQSQKVREAIGRAIKDNRLDDYTRMVLEKGGVGAAMYKTLAVDDRLGSSQKDASLYLDSLGIPGIKFLDGASRNRPLKDIKREFLAELPEDAEFEEVLDLVGTGRFSPANEAIITALVDNDWLGFDYPAQAISAALGNRLSDFDPTPELMKAVADAQDGGTYNYVIFHDDYVEVQAKHSRAVDNPAGDVVVGWKLLATDPDLFKLPKSEAKELPDIFAEIDPGIRVMEDSQEAKSVRQETGKPVSRAFVLEMPRQANGRTAYDKVFVYEAGREVWINAATLKEGVSGGFKVYAGVGNYAFNAGKVFIGDPMGLSDAALLRRTEHMLSLALKFGTTSFMQPHPKQVAPASDSQSKLKGKVRPLDWRAGDDEHNLVELVKGAYTNILPFAPEVRNVDFDPVSGKFLHAESRKPVTDAEWDGFQRLFDSRLESAGVTASVGGGQGGTRSQSRSPLSGGATLKRAAFAHSLLRRESRADRRNLLAFLSGKLQGGIEGELPGVAGTDLSGAFYRRKSQQPAGPLPAGTFNAAQDYVGNLVDNLVYNYQDRFIDLRKLQAKIGKVPESQDVSLAETRYSGAVMARTQGFQKGERDPLLKAIHDAKLTYEEVEDYLNAKDAPYRNAAMKAINPTQAELDTKRAALEAETTRLFGLPAVKDYIATRRELRRFEDEVDEGLADASSLFAPKQKLARLKKDADVAAYIKATEDLAQVRAAKPFQGDNTALSGMSDQDAAALVAKAKADGKHAALEKISGMVDAITAETRKTLVDAGLMKQEEVDVWAKKYPHYIPRHREEVGGDMPVIGTGRGFNIRGKESKRATGSDRKVVDILAHIMAQRETAIIRAEKVKVDRALYELLKANPDPAVATLDTIAKTRMVDPTTGTVVDRVDPLYKNRPNVLTFKMNGEEHTIEFNDENPEMVRLAVSLKNMDSQQLGDVTKMVGRFTRFLATMNTTANPVFVARNFLRDLQTAFVNLSDTELAKMKGDVFRDITKAIRGFWNMNEGRMNSEFAKYAKEFRDAGGQTGWMEHTQVIGDRAKEMKAQLERMQPGKWNVTKQQASKLWEMVEDANNAVENGIRLSAFVNARRAGLSTAKAAELAKNLTVNFNRRGAKSVELNMWYMFMNASIQGTARIARAATNPDVQKILGYIVASGFLLDLLARALADDDDDDGENDYDQLPEYVKASNWVFWIGGKPITVPQPYGYNFISTAGRKVSEMLFRENYSPLTAAAELTSAFVGAFSPIGQAGSALQAAAPTIADPFVQWAENKNFAGNPLYKEQLPFGVPKPEYQMAFKSTSESSKWIAEFLNDLTGGNEVRPGAININPAGIDFAISSLVGGAGRSYLQAFNLPIKALSGEDIEAREVPFLNIFGSAKPESQIEGQFFEYLGKVELAVKEAKEYAGTPEGIRYRQERQAELSLKARAKVVSASLRILRDKEKQVGVTPEQRRAIEKRKQDLMAGFNKAYRERVLQ